MNLAHTLASMALLLPLLATAQPLQPGAQDTPLPATSATQSSEGFSASMVITADPDWQQKWEFPPDVAPRFDLATEVKEGGSLYILSFLSNPKLDAQGITQVRCDLRISKPDGSLSGDEHDLPCFVTALETDPKLVYLPTIGGSSAVATTCLFLYRIDQTTHEENLRKLQEGVLETRTSDAQIEGATPAASGPAGDLSPVAPRG